MGPDRVLFAFATTNAVTLPYISPLWFITENSLMASLRTESWDRKKPSDVALTLFPACTFVLFYTDGIKDSF